MFRIFGSKMQSLIRQGAVSQASSTPVKLRQRFRTTVSQFATSLKLPEVIQKTTFHQPKDGLVKSAFHNANDERLAEAIQKTFARKTCQLPKGKKSLGLIVGDGHFLSLSRLIHCDGLLHVDISKELTHSIRLRRRLLAESASEEEFLAKLKLAPFHYKLIEHYSKHSYAAGIETLGHDHVFASPTNWLEAKKSMQKPFSAATVDLFDANQVKELGREIEASNHIITYMNVTNLMDYDDQQKLIPNLKFLPMIKDPHFIFSARATAVNKFFHNENFPCIATESKSFAEMDTMSFKLRVVENYFLYLDEKNATNDVLSGKLDWRTYTDRQGHSLLFSMMKRLDYHSFCHAIKEGAQFCQTDFREKDPDLRLKEMIDLLKIEISYAETKGCHTHRGKDMLVLLQKEGLKLVPQSTESLAPTAKRMF